jgi:hypothetical protein
MCPVILHLSVIGEKMGGHQPFTPFKKAYNSGRREVLYKILIKINTPVN